jgi:hypothetical protein
VQEVMVMLGMEVVEVMEGGVMGCSSFQFSLFALRFPFFLFCLYLSS